MTFFFWWKCACLFFQPAEGEMPKPLATKSAQLYVNTQKKVPNCACSTGAKLRRADVDILSFHLAIMLMQKPTCTFLPEFSLKTDQPSFKIICHVLRGTTTTAYFATENSKSRTLYRRVPESDRTADNTLSIVPIDSSLWQRSKSRVWTNRAVKLNYLTVSLHYRDPTMKGKGVNILALSYPLPRSEYYTILFVLAKKNIQLLGLWVWLTAFSLSPGNYNALSNPETWLRS